MEENPVVEVREEFTTYDNPLVKQHPMADTTFHFPMEGHVGSSNWVYRPFYDTEGIEYVPNAPSWRTYMGAVISKFGMTIPLFFNPLLNEDMYRRL